MGVQPHVLKLVPCPRKGELILQEINARASSWVKQKTKFRVEFSRYFRHRGKANQKKKVYSCPSLIACHLLGAL